jgi:hypothetical protein
MVIDMGCDKIVLNYELLLSQVVLQETIIQLLVADQKWRCRDEKVTYSINPNSVGSIWLCNGQT